MGGGGKLSNRIDQELQNSQPSPFSLDQIWRERFDRRSGEEREKKSEGFREGEGGDSQGRSA